MFACNVRTSICRHIVRVNQKFIQILGIQRHYSTRNHYETLNLKPDCTAKDIRDSFVKLSKKNHPDTGENTRQNADKFRDIVEAYRVLGKADSRATYDSVMNQGKAPYAVYNYDESSQTYQNHSNAQAQRYYGVFGSKRISNRRIVMYCMIFMVVGAIVQALAIRYSVTFRREKLDRVSMEAGENHSKARANAIKYGNDSQLQKLAQKSTEGNGTNVQRDREPDQ